jgi:integrase
MRAEVNVRAIRNADGSMTFYARWKDTDTAKSVQKKLLRTEPEVRVRSFRVWRTKAHQQAYALGGILAGGADGPRPGIVWLRLKDAVREYLIWCRAEGPHGIPNAVEATTINRQRILEEFLAFTRGRWPKLRAIHHVLLFHVASWRDGALIPAKLAPGTVNAKLATVSAWFSWAVDHGRCWQNPCASLKRLPNPQRERPALTVQTASELRELLEVLPEARRRAAICVLATTGLRQGEFKLLTWEHWDEAERMIAVTGSEHERTKRHRRTIPLCAQATQALSLLRQLRADDDGPYICGAGHNRRPMTAQLNAWLKGADVTPHDLRRFFRTAMETIGAPGPLIDDLLGHVTSRVRKAYTPTVNLEAAREWIDRLEEWLGPANLATPPAARQTSISTE